MFTDPARVQFFFPYCCRRHVQTPSAFKQTSLKNEIKKQNNNNNKIKNTFCQSDGRGLNKNLRSKILFEYALLVLYSLFKLRHICQVCLHTTASVTARHSVLHAPPLCYWAWALRAHIAREMRSNRLRLAVKATCDSWCFLTVEFL